MTGTVSGLQQELNFSCVRPDSAPADPPAQHPCSPLSNVKVKNIPDRKGMEKRGTGVRQGRRR